MTRRGPKPEEEYQDILNMFFEKSILNVNIITTSRTDPKKSTVYTYYPYFPYSCGQPKLVVHNVFKNGCFLDKQKPFPEKLRNFHRCPLTVATFNISKFVRIIPTSLLFNETGGRLGWELIGFEGTLLNLMSKLLNFTIELEIPEEKWGEIYPNGTFTGASKLVR